MNLVTALKSILWSPSQGSSELLTKMKIPHGFCGVGVQVPNDLQYAKQVHGVGTNEFTTIQTTEENLNISADASWTRVQNIKVAVRTADCLPILMTDKHGTMVCAIHAGWRGLTSGILVETIQTLGIKPADLVICIGPAIGRERFEVGPEVIDAMYSRKDVLSSEAANLAVSKGQGDRWHMDLATAAALQLLEQGVLSNKIEVIQACTFNLSNQWHSFRREGSGQSSNWSWIQCSPVLMLLAF